MRLGYPVAMMAVGLLVVIVISVIATTTKTQGVTIGLQPAIAATDDEYGDCQQIGGVGDPNAFLCTFQRPGYSAETACFVSINSGVDCNW